MWKGKVTMKTALILNVTPCILVQRQGLFITNSNKESFMKD